MSDFQTQALFGSTANTSQLMPGDWNPSGADSTDIGAILQQGIVGTVQKAINAAVGEKYADGQLTAQQVATPAYNNGNGGLLWLVVAGLVVYAVAKAS